MDFPTYELNEIIVTDEMEWRIKISGEAVLFAVSEI